MTLLSIPFGGWQEAESFAHSLALKKQKNVMSYMPITSEASAHPGAQNEAGTPEWGTKETGKKNCI